MKTPLRRGFCFLRLPRAAHRAAKLRLSRHYHHAMSNVDPQELAKFSELAHRWWDPDSEFRPLHQINPLRLDWIDQLGAACAARRVLDVGCGGGILAEAMARRGASVLGIDLAGKPLKVAQLHALEAGIDDVDYREVAAEALAQETPAHSMSSPAWRCSSTCPTRRRSCAPAPRWSSRAAGCSSPRINRNPKSFLFAIVGAEHVLQPAAQGHARIRALHPAERAGALVPRRRAGAARHARHGIQPAHAALLAVRRHQRQLPVRAAAGRHDALVRGASRRAVRPGRHPDRQRTRPGRRRATRCALARGLPPLPLDALRPMVGSRRARHGRPSRCRCRPGTTPFDALRDEFLDRYASSACRARRRVFDADAAGARTPSTRAGLPLGHRHQQGDALHDAAWSTALGLAARAAVVIAATPRRTPSRTPRRCSRRRAGWAWRAGALRLRRRRPARRAGRPCRRHAHAGRRLGLPRRRASRSRTGAPTPC